MSGQFGEGTSQSLQGETSQSVRNINHLPIDSTQRTTPQGTVRQRYLLGKRPVPQIPHSHSVVQSQIKLSIQPRITGYFNLNQIYSPPWRCTNQYNARPSHIPNHRWRVRYDPRRDGSQPPHQPTPQLNTGQQQRHGQANSRKSFKSDKLRYENKEDDSLNEDQGNNQPRSHRAMGFQALEEIAYSDPKDAIAKINARKESFLLLINSKLNTNRDIYFLVLQILSKVSQSSFDELKSRLLIEVCHSEFITNLRNYLMDLPYNNSSHKAANRFYWENQEMFWEKFIILSEAIFDIAPSVALHKCRTLIEATSKSCLDELKTRHSFSLSVENQTRLTNLYKRLSAFEQKNVVEEQRKRCTNEESEDNEPPEDFRQLTVVPKRNDLLEGRPYVRANVVRGAYQDVEHYLDVQFRLLREDCFGPVRVGLLQFIEDPNKKEYDNIRVYRDVRFVEPYIGKNHIGVTIQLDWNSMKKLRHVDWSQSKRFIFGSLLFFTNDYCQSFIATTIIDRDIKHLAEGKIPVRVIEHEDSLTVNNIDYKSTYIMIESEIYFEPYLHVMKALQHPNFPTHLAMSQYIVKVQTEASPPKYVTDTLSYLVQTVDDQVIKFNVLNPLTWPSQEMLGFNESQHEAYKLALTHEFAVIQGPPGTGKTYLGVNVAKTLLNNVSNVSRIIRNNKCVMLVICYTNHALDQFLEHILTITRSIVRIGGQSKNPAMEEISIETLRKVSNSWRNEAAYNLLQSEKNKLRLIVGELEIAQNRIKSLNDGIILYHDLQTFVPEANVLHQFYRQCKKDIIETWLFENMPYTNLQQILELKLVYDVGGVDDDSDANRTDTDMDELRDTAESIGDRNKISTCNILEECKLNRLISSYNNCTDVYVRKRMATEIQHLHSRMTFFKEMRDTYRANGVPRELRVDEDLSLLSNIDRWSLYFSWTEKVIEILTQEIIPLQVEVNSAISAYEEAKMIFDLHLLRNSKVVGMTTSGAARRRKLLVELAPPIVIVEEAAEVLEQHIVTSLTSSCQHLILIGDHQQLRPSVAFMRLARHYNIDVSLFERMVLNGMHSRRLSVQHRMRPEIAALISPHVYPDLANHSSVDNFPHVRGMTTDLFFYTHNYKEDKTPGDHTIRSNKKEAEVVLGLANYLMQQDYKPSDVTILVTYVGQLFYMKKQSQKYPFLKGVKITVVDNYQGEESRIILLSLVRNNEQNKIGFLGTDNRICVALSRAKEGFYIFGNIDTLTSNSKLWAKVNQTLEDKGFIGTELRLKCENHPNQLTTIKTVDDFNTVPEGGCLLKCNYNLSACQHRCPRICHGYDLDHTVIKCQQDCERVICELGHVCPLKCGRECEPCSFLVKKTLPCGHDQQVACHLKPDDSAIKCTVVVEVTLPLCGHEAKKLCSVPLNHVGCLVRCVHRLDCGHACRRSCHVANDPHHEKYLCRELCARAKKDCSANLEEDLGDHQCSNLCHETCPDCTVRIKKKRSTCKHSELVECRDDVNAKPCLQKCARVLPCTHYCKKKCYEPCGDCAQPVEKTIPECKHTMKLACMLEPKHKMCREPCERYLPCGHRCPGRCGLPCDETACVEIIDTPVDSPCGHKVKLPCNVFNKRFSDPQLLPNHCTTPCAAMLKCSHLCRGSCSRCAQGRLHAPCTQPCHKLNICGHQCEEPCNQLCPPCEKPCEVKCVHSQCPNICGAPCTPCQEPCQRSCPHGSCSRRCGAQCTRAPCDRACARALRCGHACRGLCGEPCPPVCRICKPDDFPKGFLNEDFEEDAMFVQLEDCGHILNVEDADNLMQGDKETIYIRSCPFCRKPIINTYRYKDFVNKMYKTEINPIKERIYGTKAKINEKRENFSKTLKMFCETHERVLSDNEHFRTTYRKLENTFKKRNKKVSILQIDMHLLYINILDMIGEKYKKFITAKLESTHFLDQVRLLCNFLGNNIQKISQQQQEDIRHEIKRLHCILQLSIIKNHPSYNASKNNPTVMESEKKATSCVISLNIFEEHTAITALNIFSEAIKLNTRITMEERDLIVKAMGFKQGHWFKCPNGHIYCITECGGAMEVAKCNECGEAIGGQSHRLLPSNNVAGEMDGARFPAWSEEYNNMNNFLLDND